MKFTVLLLVAIVAGACDASVYHNLREIKNCLDSVHTKPHMVSKESVYVKDLKKNGAFILRPEIFCQAAKVLSNVSDSMISAQRSKISKNCNRTLLIRNLEAYSDNVKNCTDPKGDDIPLHTFLEDLKRFTQKEMAKP